MTSPPLDGWATWSAEWQASHADAAIDLHAIAARARRRARLLRALVAGEVLTSLGLLWLVWSVLSRRVSAITVAWAATAVLALAVTWVFSIRNRRHTWNAVGERTVDYVRLSRTQAQAALRTVRFVRGLLAAVWSAQLLLLLVDGQPLAPGAPLVAGGVFLYSVGVLVWARWYRRRALRELAETEVFEESLAAE